MNKFLFAISLIILMSCASSQELSSVSPILENKKVSVIDIDKAEKSDSLYFSTYFKKPKVIILETKANCIIQKIRSIEMFKDNIYICDDKSKALYVFNNDGKFIRKIGNRGNGHGEYYSINDFSIDRKKEVIYLWDGTMCKAHKYDINTGKYISSVITDKLGSQTSSIQFYNDKLYVDKMSDSNDEEKYSINEVDEKTGKLIAKYMDSERYNSGWNFPLNLQNSYFYSKNSDSPKFIELFSDTIVSLTPKGIKPIYAIKSKRFVRKSDFDDLPDNSFSVDYYKLNEKLNERKRIRFISSYVEFKDKISLEYLDTDRRQYLVYDKKKNKSCFSPFFVNDYISKENAVPTRLCYCDNKYVLAVLETPYFPVFLEHILSKGRINTSIDQYDKFMKLKENSNPVLFYHELK